MVSELILSVQSHLQLAQFTEHPHVPPPPSSRRLALRRCAVLATRTLARSRERRRSQATNGIASRSTASGHPAIVPGLRGPLAEIFSFENATMTSGGWCRHISSFTRTCARIRRCDCTAVGHMCFYIIGLMFESVAHPRKCVSM